MSLDAPLIAVLWQVLLAENLHVRLQMMEPLVLALTVWCVYVCDQVLDVRRPPATGWEPARKVFCRRHFPLGVGVGLGVAAVSAALSFGVLKRATLHAGLALTIPVVGYFALVHLAPPEWRGRWPREAVVATLFTLGTLLGVWMADGQRSGPLRWPAVVFFLLCWTNVSAIETWEWQASVLGESGLPSVSARWAARHLNWLGTGIAALALLLGLASAAPVSFDIAACGSGLALALLAECQTRLRANVSRVAAEAALCTPLLALVFHWLR